MNKSELIERIAGRQSRLSDKDVEHAVRLLLGNMIESIGQGGRIEIRGFGSFSLHYRNARSGRNPKTGEVVALPGKFAVHFRAGKELRERVCEGMVRQSAMAAANPGTMFDL